MADALVGRHRWLSLHRGYRDEPFLRSSDGVIIVPVNAAGEILFITEPTQFDNSPVLTLPAGAAEADTPGESANLELQEEIGFRAQRLEFLHEFRPLARHADWRIYAFLARDLVESSLPRDEPYEIVVTPVPMMNVDFLIRSGQLRDSTAIAAIFLARQILH
jgi:8-oxo-dGTP pyrophosphatase MutT (NUDIX family)